MPNSLIALTLLRQIEKHNDRRIADRSVMAGEGEAASFAVDAEGGDVVAALVARIEKLAGGVEVEAAWVVAARPFFAGVFQGTVLTHCEDPDAVVQTVARIKEFAIPRHQNARAEIAAGKPGRQRRNRL